MNPGHAVLLSAASRRGAHAWAVPSAPCPAPCPPPPASPEQTQQRKRPQRPRPPPRAPAADAPPRALRAATRQVEHEAAVAARSDQKRYPRIGAFEAWAFVPGPPPALLSLGWHRTARVCRPPRGPCCRLPTANRLPARRSFLRSNNFTADRFSGALMRFAEAVCCDVLSRRFNEAVRVRAGKKAPVLLFSKLTQKRFPQRDEVPLSHSNPRAIGPLKRRACAMKAHAPPRARPGRTAPLTPPLRPRNPETR